MMPMIAVTEQTMQRLLSPDLLPLLIPIGGLVVGAIAVIAHAWLKISTHKADVELKRDMIARGMSVEEIERVIRARPSMKD